MPLNPESTMGLITDPLADPEFMRGLTDVTVVAIISGVVGAFIVLRGIGFLGDALAHSIFPGVVIAFLVGGNLMLGALVSGLLTAAMMGGLTANQRVQENTSIGVIYTSAFALGVVILAFKTIESGELEEILFGDPLGASTNDVILTLLIGAAVLSMMVGLWRLFVMASFDPSGARAMGLPVLSLDILLLLVSTLTVVVAFKAVGNILVISLLLTPAATARMLTSRLVPMTIVAAVLGVVASITGLVVGYRTDTSAGGVIVLVSAGMFFAAWLFAPRTGFVPSMIARRSQALLRTEPEAEAEIILASPEIQAPHGA
jgi:manganese/iron transport system permease protein